MRVDVSEWRTRSLEDRVKDLKASGLEESLMWMLKSQSQILVLKMSILGERGTLIRALKV